MTFDQYPILRESMNKTREIIQYYRTGPLGDIPAINGKVVEEAIRHVLTDMGYGPVTTNGLVDLGIKSWETGFQVKTFRTCNNTMILARSSKPNKELRIVDIKDRVVESMKNTETKRLILLNVDILSLNFELYLLASMENTEIKTYGTFLDENNVWISPTGTQFSIKKSGLEKLS